MFLLWCLNFLDRFNLEIFIKAASIKNITVALKKKKKLPVLLTGKNSKKIIRKKGKIVILDIKLRFRLLNLIKSKIEKTTIK